MGTLVSTAVIVFILQFCAAVYERNHGRKRKDHNLQTIKYQEHRDVSLLYGNTKDIEDSRQQRAHHLDGYNLVAPSIKLLKRPTKHHVNPRMRLVKRNSSDIGKSKQVVKAHSSVRASQNQGSNKAALTAKVFAHNSEKSTKRNLFSAESGGDEILPSIKRYRIPSKRVRHRHTEARKRAKVEEVLRKERQKIAKTIDLLDDLPGAYSRGIDMNGMDINEVNLIDNNTLSDYFHALNDNGSGANNNDDDNDVSVYTPTTSSTPSKLTWDEVTPSDTEDGNSGNDDFYDAIDNGEPPPPLKMKNTRPTKSHFDQYNGKPNNIDPVTRHSETTSRPSNFRPPSQEDFENFFQGMLDRFGNGRPNKSAQQKKNYDIVNQKTHKDQNNITAFLDAHDGLRNGNVKKLVSLGSPERVDITQQMQQNNMAPDDEMNPTYSKNGKAQKDRESEAIESFLSPNAPIYWTKRPFGNKSKLASEQQSQEDRPNSFKYPWPPFAVLPSKQPNNSAARAHDATSTLIPFTGTRIMGGKISGGQISGGLIQGGQIKAGLIEGGVIKGGQVVGGHITNGTMEGGVVADGQMLGGHLVNGRIEGGRLMGGNVFGGKILGGTVEGGEMKGGVVAGGRFRGGSMQGGLLKGGEIQGGIIKGGKVEGGVVHGGNIEGGEFKFGDISGGTLKAGAMLGGMMKNGSIEGGTLKGGTIEGGVLKGGVMEGGQLKGGLVLAGKIKGGIIEGGVIEGGEIGDGVLITGGKVNATIIGTGSSIDKNQKLGGLFKQGENSQQLGLKLDQQKYHHGGHKPVYGSKMMSDSLPGVPESTNANPGLKELNPNTNLKIPLREGTLKMLPQVSDSSDDDNLEKLLLEGKSANDNLEPELSSQRFFEEQDQPSRVVQKKGGKHHVVLDGVGFDLPTEDFVDLIDKMKNADIINYYEQPERKEDLKIRHTPRPTKSATSSEMKNLHIKPDDFEKKLSFPTKPRSSVTGTDKKKSQHDKKEDESPNVKNGEMKAVKLKPKDGERLRPTYHWSLNRLIKDRIPGSPGPAIRTHGEMKVIRGGLHLNGHNAWLGAGDFSGGCISDPDTCEDGLSFEMTFRLDKGALKYNDMNYIVDSGASTFNSKGFSLYTVQGNLRADLAIANQEFCLQIPVTVRKWQDILVTWKKSEGMKMYVNCELQAHAKGNEHCIGCHSKGCHVTDTNTLLMIGRPNYSPHFHCTKFDSGDISFWEKYLSSKDVETLCGAPTGEIEKTSASLPAVILPEINQVKFPLQSINQAAYQANVLQRYRANQPYFNQFTELPPRRNYMSRQLFTPWSVWSACSKKCGVGVRARRRSCIDPKFFPGLCSGISIQHQSCFDRRCPAYLRALPGRILTGQQSRLFTYNQASYFPGQFRYPFASRVNSGTEPALARALTTGGGYSEWSVWGTCDRSCGGGAQVRTRICNRPASSGDGNMCHSLGPSIQVKRCNRKGCPVDGGYSQWSQFGACSKTCGTGGIRRRYRTCTNPAPMNGGKPCFGRPYQSRVCRIGTCPVDGGYGTWSPWLPCDADCGGGIQERSRFCDNPVPQPGAKDCAVLGPEKETRLCNVFPCNVNF